MIKSERLELRYIELTDLSAIHALHSLPETDQYNALGIPETVDVTREIIKSWVENNQQTNPQQYTFAIEDSSHHFIGLLGMKVRPVKYRGAEIWYKLHRDFWGKGYATEAVHAILDFGFNTLDLHRMEAGCAVDNVASIKVLEKVGMVREGRKRAHLPLKSGWSDNFEFGILVSEWRS